MTQELQQMLEEIEQRQESRNADILRTQVMSGYRPLDFDEEEE